MATPSPIAIDPLADPRAFRTALGQFPTGVTVITCVMEGQKVGITANSFASVSLDPPLVLWSPAKSSRRHDVFAEASHFAIHILANDQMEIANGFVREANAFGGVDHLQSATGVPLIQGCVARFECTNFANHDAGDHTLIIGQVTSCVCAVKPALTFHAGKYAQTATNTEL